MLTGLYYAHSGLRWLVVLAAAVALLFMLFSLFTNREQDRVTRIVMLAFSSLIGLQWVLGIIYYLTFGAAAGDYNVRNQATHAAVMTIVVIVAHLYLPFRRRASNRVYYIASTVVVFATIGLIVYGVSTLVGPGRWSMSPLYVPAL